MEVSKINGYDIKDKKSVRTYDTVASMKIDGTIKEGQHVKTRGYYEINDGGSAEYYITSTESLTDYQEELNSGLYATLITKSYVTPEMFGAKGDGINDDSNAFTMAFQSNKAIKCCKNKTYGITHVNLNNSNIYLDGQGCTLKNIKLDMSEYATGTIDFKGISSMFSDYVPSVSETLVTYNKATFKNFIIDQDSDNVTGLNNEMHWGGLFTPILLVGCDNIYVDNISVINTLQTGLYFYNAKNVKATNCHFENIGNNEYLNTGSRNCFEVPSWNNAKTKCVFDVSNISAIDIHDEFARTDVCEFVNIVNSNFKNIGGMIVESHSSSDREYPDTKYINIDNISNIDSKGLMHINEQNTNVNVIVNVNNTNNLNSDGVSNFYGAIYLSGKIQCNINNSHFSHSNNKYGQGYISIRTGSNINISNSYFDMENQTPLLRNYEIGQNIKFSNCIIKSGNIAKFENGGYLTIENCTLNSNYFITGVANTIKIINSELNPVAQYGIQPEFTNGIFEFVNNKINSVYDSPSTFISLSGTLKELKFINNIINSVSTTRVRFGSVTNMIEFIGNFVDADSTAFTGDRALTQDCLSLFTNNICKGTTFGISGTPTISGNNHNFDITS